MVEELDEDRLAPRIAQFAQDRRRLPHDEVTRVAREEVERVVCPAQSAQRRETGQPGLVRCRRHVLVHQRLGAVGAEAIEHLLQPAGRDRIGRALVT
jgi:hypothetical protein